MVPTEFLDPEEKLETLVPQLLWDKTQELSSPNSAHATVLQVLLAHKDPLDPADHKEMLEILAALATADHLGLLDHKDLLADLATPAHRALLAPLDSSHLLVPLPLALLGALGLLAPPDRKELLETLDPTVDLVAKDPLGHLDPKELLVPLETQGLLDLLASRVPLAVATTVHLLALLPDIRRPTTGTRRR